MAFLNVQRVDVDISELGKGSLYFPFNKFGLTLVLYFG